ncbi:MAG: hypothetical protein PHI23_03785 [Candidatus Peribacteraceae bacterium]|nr:hypothetical protein [Candidatus Peribacteraceae bacterium]
MELKIPVHSKCIAAAIVRVSFGLSLLFVGLVHYMTFTAFRGMVSEDLAALSVLGTIWAFILPALMIVGGALLVIGMFPEIAAWTAGIAIGSIPAGMLLKSVLSGLSLSSTMPAAINAMIFLLVYLVVVKSSSCCSGKDGCCSSK